MGCFPRYYDLANVAGVGGEALCLVYVPHAEFRTAFVCGEIERAKEHVRQTADSELVAFRSPPAPIATGLTNTNPGHPGARLR